MNNFSFLGILFGLLSAMGGVLFFLSVQGPRVERMRGVFSRICLQLTSSSIARYPHANFDEFRPNIRQDADALTAMEFLKDCRREDRTLLDRVAEISPSLFLPHIGALVGLGLLLAVVIAPIVVGALFAIPPIGDYIADQVKLGKPDALPFLFAIAAGLGVITVGASIMFIWAVAFERHMSSLIVTVEQELLWNVSRGLPPAERRLVLPKDDLAFTNLKK